MKQELLKSKTDTLSILPYKNNRPVVSTSATVTITDPGGAAIVSAASATVNSTTGEITYDFLSTANTKLGENFQAQWDYIISAVHYYQTTLFDVVLNRIAIPVVDKDLTNEQADILEKNESFSGLVDSSSNTTLVDTELKAYEDDYWNGGTVVVINPATGVEQSRTVTDFVASSGTLTAGVAWDTNPTSTYRYKVTKGFAAKIEAAFEEVMMDVKSKGYRPALILESSELKIPILKKALAMVCRDFMREVGDKWDGLAIEYDKQYKDLFSKVVFQYDKNESGYISGEEKQQDLGSVRMRR